MLSNANRNLDKSIDNKGEMIGLVASVVTEQTAKLVSDIVLLVGFLSEMAF
jgi:hypothetical protein